MSVIEIAAVVSSALGVWLVTRRKVIAWPVTLLACVLYAEVFREALAGIAKFEWRGVPFIAWLLRIASRAIADHWQRSGRESGNPAQDTARPGPEEIERSAMLFQLVDRLPEAQFRVIHMRFVEQKSIREIATEMNRSEGAVKQLQLRAIENLRAQMEGAHA